MEKITAASQALGLVQLAKEDASAFCTNFFPAPGRLEGWIQRGELCGDQSGKVAFLLRKVRDFWHLHYAAPDPESLQSALAAMPWMRQVMISTDVVGPAESLAALAAPLQRAGLRPYTRLVRLARPVQPGSNPAADSPGVGLATQADAGEILRLLETLFNRYADQLPLDYEIGAAIGAGQILTLRQEGKLAAFLHFETQGQSSTLRFWVVAPDFQGRGCGSTLIRSYFAREQRVRRFVLWVNSANAAALGQYRHYGYHEDRLSDQVLVNDLISS